MSRITAYTKVSVGTGTPSQIMISLFQTALRHMRASASAFERGDYNSGSIMAEKAAAIVLGLQGTLKEEVAPDLCARLHELYTFVACRLGLAGTKFSAAHVAEAEQVFAPIADAFIQAASSPAGQAAAAAAR
jgi:flagellar biosynthetic protein FliS